MGCLYQLAFPNGKSYIGMTVSDPRKRLWEHNYNAEKGSPLAVAQAIRKFGRDAVQFKVLVVAKGRDYLAQLERNAIRVFGTRKPNGYNLTDGGDGAPVGNTYNLGKKRTMESRAKMSASARGRPRTKEQREAVSRAMMGNKFSLGRKLSDEHKARISVANKGRKWTAEQRAGMSIAAYGRKKSEVQRERHRAAMIGNNFCLGRKHSEETKAKIAVAHKGRKFSDATREKMSIAACARIATRRAARSDHGR